MLRPIILAIGLALAGSARAQSTCDQQPDQRLATYCRLLTEANDRVTIFADRAYQEKTRADALQKQIDKRKTEDDEKK